MKITTFNLLQLHNLVKEYGFIAGGACRATIQGEEIKDYDIFCYTKEGYLPLYNLFSNMYGEKRENALVYQVANIQLIKPRENERLKTYGSPQEVVSKFDFTVCRVYTTDGITFQNIDSSFFDDLKKKQLNIKNIVCPISTTKRVIKYSKKGYFIKTRQILNLFDFWRKSDIKDDFFNQLGTLLDEEEADGNDFKLYELLAQYNID